MSREIIFRGKRIDNGEWVYGYLFKSWDRAYILWGTTNGVPNMTEVDTKTVGQTTGLNDRKVKEIYEGDIGYVLIDRYSDPKVPFLSVVECDRCFWNFRHLERDDLHEIWPKDQFEIIGNKYDNPDLLELAQSAIETTEIPKP
jgi:uncharacterized phage protein (TIGR01671 family)